MRINHLTANTAGLWLTGLFISLLTVSLAQAAPPEGYGFLNLTRAWQQSTAEQKPIFLYFGRYGCSTCRKMHQEVFSDSSVMENLTQTFVLAYVDTESGRRIKMPTGEKTTEMQFAVRNRILGTPTFVYFSAQQKPLFKRAGFQSIEQMNRYSRYVGEGHFKTASLKDYLQTVAEE